ncbi:UDP-N-acetylmuramate dehydrogenase [Algoriphagus formosus]|uniref:UDP-N-acetylenolpyruvoylglucosamine reductase n=1 Tax=Algoriphagus formosus TaxID=2007308 RepID=A0A4R5UUY6_9BACT|nr:UDP-N-acetylmuramate dehydrogenase [Algoriphagus aquimaris]TDK42875.1 UDP-N-acetylmuramate dehydrogenase [Algoriphagus aquimaris]
MNIQENTSLKPYNTFGIDAKTRFFTKVSGLKELKEALLFAEAQTIPILILGGGSNILLTQDFTGLVIKLELKGIKVVEEDSEKVLVSVGAGENWHEFVLFAIAQNWAGIENLSLIPGTVGASPMQNIGAYGVEIQQVFHHLKALNRKTLELETFSAEECQFGYRESVFKHRLKNKYIICEVVFQLSKIPLINISYGAIKDTLAEMKAENPGIKEVSDAVIAIRQSKLPNPAEIGNAGSFFKNPTISESTFEKLKNQFPEIPGYKVDEGIKVPAAWLIDQAGWKGFRRNDVGVHNKQALVLVNFGKGKGKEIQELSQEIQKSVEEKFGIKLSPEVNFI